MYGCEAPTQLPAWVIDDYEFYVCPNSFISTQILTWYKKYKQIKNGICKPIDYDTANPKFFEAINVYENHFDNFRSNQSKKQEQDKNFKKLDDIKKWEQKE